MRGVFTCDYCESPLCDPEGIRWSKFPREPDAWTTQIADGMYCSWRCHMLDNPWKRLERRFTSNALSQVLWRLMV